MLSLLLALAFAAAPDADDAVDALVRQALDREPGLAAAHARVTEAQSAAALGVTAPLPMLELEAMSDAMGMATLDVMVEQTLLLGGERRAAAAMGEAGIDAAEARARGEALALEGEVRAAAAMAAGADARVAALVEQAHLVIAQEASAQAMIAAGMGSTSELAMVEMARGEVSGRLAEARAEAAMARADLARWVGGDPGPLPLPELPDPVAPAADPPMVQEMAAMRRMAEAEQDMARAERVPMVTLAGGVSLRTPAMGSTMAIVGVGGTLPGLAARKQRARLASAVAAVEAAGADVDAARAELAAVRAGMEAEVRAALLQAEAAADMARAARAQADNARAAYVAGRASADPWLAAEIAAWEAEEMRGMRVADACVAHARMAAMVGVSLLEAP